MRAVHHDTPLLRSLRIQLRVIGALLMREIITRYGRHNIGFLWVFIEPMLFTLGVTALWTLTKSTHGSSLPITAFAVSGYSSVLLWRNCANRCALAIQPNLSLLYHRNVRVIDLFFARLVLEISGATISAVVLTSFFSIVGLMELPQNLSLVIGGWVYLAVFGSGLGLIVGALSERSETADRLWHTIAYLLFPLSGSVFMVEWLPTSAQKLILFLPMVHGVEMLRAGYFGSLVKPHYNVEFMVIADLVFLFVGLLMARDASKRVEPE
ncbi:ABC transporter permease [Ralstonia insidiosa]|jgi:capsular polysaccharide transport system permease protein|uniref:ABC transporter permease n=1 Tax=Ralstonia TaxID=48736 RepID=UPI00066486F0|nr:ABC transporter permease [Ralstonia insidiosa]KMW47020.1 sugar ABC transporter permease [Ralstonia sp. MD27]KMY65546.1 sugar ABC transporter permease [Desulfocarbo indianensis]MBX3775486.1 ABC transporter permease [Ralstonia pickettii]NPA01107.1 ABC transporter permease [Betaproteobacteria bacterium]MBA9859668.1 ABC transporter permease [Ralstonia insidiosa]